MLVVILYGAAGQAGSAVGALRFYLQPAVMPSFSTLSQLNIPKVQFHPSLLRIAGTRNRYNIAQNAVSSYASGDDSDISAFLFCDKNALAKFNSSSQSIL